MKAYPPPLGLSDESFETRRVILDKHGVILAWYLLDILPPQRQVRLIFIIVRLCSMLLTIDYHMECQPTSSTYA